jgi:hypothetical protein
MAASGGASFVRPVSYHWRRRYSSAPAGAAVVSPGSRSSSEAIRWARNGAVPPRCANWKRIAGWRSNVPE